MDVSVKASFDPTGGSVNSSLSPLNCNDLISVVVGYPCLSLILIPFTRVVSTSSDLHNSDLSLLGLV